MTATTPVGRDRGSSRNRTRTKTLLTEIGPVQIEVPRDRDASFDPVIVRKRQRRLDGIDEIVLSLTARSLTTGEVAARFGSSGRNHLSLRSLRRSDGVTIRPGGDNNASGRRGPVLSYRSIPRRPRRPGPSWSIAAR